MTLTRGFAICLSKQNLGPEKPPTADGLTSNIKLGPASSTEPLIDIASGPLPRFLLREKLEQTKPPLPSFLNRQVRTCYLVLLLWLVVFSRSRQSREKGLLPSYETSESPCDHAQVESGNGKRGSRKNREKIPPADDVEPNGRTVDIILISEQQDSMTTEKRESSSQDTVRVVVHDICHCRSFVFFSSL